MDGEITSVLDIGAKNWAFNTELTAKSAPSSRPGGAYLSLSWLVMSHIACLVSILYRWLKLSSCIARTGSHYCNVTNQVSIIGSIHGFISGQLP